MPLDEFAWRVRLARRRKAHARKFKMAAGLITLTIAAIAWYLGYYMQRPEYALAQAAAAVEQHDLAAFQRRVNIAAVADAGYDDLTYVLFSRDTRLSESERSASGKFYQRIKGSVAEGLTYTIENAVQNSVWAEPEGVNALKGRQLGIDFEYLMECSHLRDTSVLSIGDVTRDGSGAVAMLTVVDEGTGLEFPLQLRMEKGDLGWQVVRVVNYRAYLEAVQMAAGSDVTRYIEATRPIVDRYNGVFRSTQYEFLYLTETAWGTYTTEHRRALIRLLQDDVIPLLKKYQRELDAVEIPRGAAYLAAQRKASTEASIASYESFIRGLDTGLPEEFARAETLHKQALTYDLRVGDMVRRSAVSEETPATP
ncbi:hypothetical protein BCS37_01400 [Selenomonas sp. oral taxon 920]|uniref:hypothetical protein n=1 Tax=Selenomonas sp. oral taxon 920 TaxID=1884263 RepID=UPI000840F285|nr:hypothetical protein [Selenomonas sp. oral taxon 920]AOH47180.1 hypothetical protein BCS37_01400 [Selenomonas sp. oral taxon 920]